MAWPAEYEAWDLEDSLHTVVLDPTGFVDEDWLAAVAAEEQGRRVLVVKLRDRPFVTAIGSVPLKPRPDDLQAVSAVVAKRNLAARRSMCFPDRSYLPRSCPRPVTVRHDEAPVVRRDPRRAARGVERGLGSRSRGATRLARGGIPYVGAGMSAPYGYRLWEDFLREAGEEFGVSDKVDPRLAKGDYEGAAQVLDNADHGGFTEKVRTAFGRRDPPPDLRTGAISYLPLLTTGPVITTNFDPIVEDAFEAAGKKLEVIHGPREELTVKAMHRNERVLLKLHGT